MSKLSYSDTKKKNKIINREREIVCQIKTFEQVVTQEEETKELCVLLWCTNKESN